MNPRPKNKQRKERKLKTMKHLKKFASLLLAMLMVMSLSANAFAADDNNEPAAPSDAPAVTKGSITINNTETVSVAKRTFNAYKILDVESFTPATDGKDATVVYTVPENMKPFFNNRYSLSGLEPDYDAQVANKIATEEKADPAGFAADIVTFIDDATNKVGITKSATAGEKDESVTIGDLDLGYYVVRDAGKEIPVSALILDTTNPEVNVSIKADKPTIDKKIDGTKDTDDTTKGDVDTNTAAVGDTVPFKLTSKVPNMEGYKHYYFVVTDTLSKGLTYKENPGVTITFTKPGENNTTETLKTLEEGTDFTVNYTKVDNGDDTLEIVFTKFIDNAKYKGADINITYSATVNKYAEMGETGNPNSVKLTYSNNPNKTESGTPGDVPGKDSPVGETTESVTHTFVTGVKLHKVDPNGKTLTGAQFQIEGTKTNIVLVTGEVFKEDPNGTYWKLTDGSYTTTDPNTTLNIDTSKYVDTETKYTKEPVTKKEVQTGGTVKATGIVDSDGYITFEGLNAGTYTITELKAPDGYNLLKDPITVTIALNPANEASEGIPAHDDYWWSYTWTQNGDTLKAEENAANTLKVVNNTGLELPETGGIGTTIFYMAGGAMVRAAVILLVTKKRMAAAP